MATGLQRNDENFQLDLAKQLTDAIEQSINDDSGPLYKEFGTIDFTIPFVPGKVLPELPELTTEHQRETTIGLLPTEQEKYPSTQPPDIQSSTRPTDSSTEKRTTTINEEPTTTLTVIADFTSDDKETVTLSTVGKQQPSTDDSTQDMSPDVPDTTTFTDESITDADIPSTTVTDDTVLTTETEQSTPAGKQQSTPADATTAATPGHTDGTITATVTEEDWGTVTISNTQLTTGATTAGLTTTERLSKSDIPVGSTQGLSDSTTTAELPLDDTTVTADIATTTGDDVKLTERSTEGGTTRKDEVSVSGPTLQATVQTTNREDDLESSSITTTDRSQTPEATEQTTSREDDLVSSPITTDTPQTPEATEQTTSRENDLVSSPITTDTPQTPEATEQTTSREDDLVSSPITTDTPQTPEATEQTTIREEDLASTLTPTHTDSTVEPTDRSTSQGVELSSTEIAPTTESQSTTDASTAVTLSDEVTQPTSATSTEFIKTTTATMTESPVSTNVAGTTESDIQETTLEVKGTSDSVNIPRTSHIPVYTTVGTTRKKDIIVYFLTNSYNGGVVTCMLTSL